MLVLFCFCVATLSADNYFPKKAWKQYDSYSLDFSIYLSKKFKPEYSSLSFAEMYARSSSPAVVISVGNYGYVGDLSKSSFYNLCDELFWDFYLSSDYDYYCDHMPSPIINIYGHHGYEFQLCEFDDDYNIYHSLFQMFLDGDGNFFTILSMSSANHSANVGQAVTFRMHNGCDNSLRKPLSASVVSPAEAAAKITSLKTQVMRLLKSMK